MLALVTSKDGRAWLSATKGSRRRRSQGPSRGPRASRQEGTKSCCAATVEEHLRTGRSSARIAGRPRRPRWLRQTLSGHGSRSIPGRHRAILGRLQSRALSRPAFPGHMPQALGHHRAVLGSQLRARNRLPILDRRRAMLGHLPRVLGRRRVSLGRLQQARGRVSLGRLPRGRLPALAPAASHGIRPQRPLRLAA
jgi:hypothetical protein